VLVDGHHPFVAHQQRTLVGQLPVIFFLQLLADRREVARAVHHVPPAQVHRFFAVRRAFDEAVIPVHLDGGHARARRELPADARADRPAFGVFAMKLLHLDRRGAAQLQRPVGMVHDVAAHVAQRAVAEITPRVPGVRMQTRVIVAERRGSDPRVPRQPLRHRPRRRTNVLGRETVGPVAPAVDRAHRPDRAGGEIFAQQAAALARLALVAQLGGHARLARLFRKLPRLGQRVGQRFLDVDVQAAPHGQQRRQRVLVVGRRDHDGVQFLAHHVEQLTVIAESPYSGSVCPGRHLADALEGILELRGVRIDQRRHALLAGRREQHVGPLPAAADQRHAHRFLLCRRVLAAHAQGRHGTRPGRRLDEIPPAQVCLHVFCPFSFRFFPISNGANACGARTQTGILEWWNDGG